MKILPTEISRALFGREPNPDELNPKDYGIEDPSEWVPIDLPYDSYVDGNPTPVKEWLDSAAADTWGKKEPKILECLSPPAIPQAPSRAPLIAGKWHIWAGSWYPISPDELPDVMLLDTEAVKYSEHWTPICAVAMGDDSLFAWVRDWQARVSNEDLIPFPSNRVVLGWNVSYDRQYLASEFLRWDGATVCPSGNQFLDGMSWATAMWGISDQQLAAYKMLSKKPFPPLWVKHASPVSLAAIHQRLFNEPLEKGVRDDIMKLTWDTWQPAIDRILSYCAQDVIATLRCMLEMFHQLRRRYVGSPISWLGQLHMSSPLITLDPDWFGYLSRCETQYHTLITKHRLMLENLALDKMYSEDGDDRLSWRKLSSGKNKGKPEWYVDYVKGDGATMSKRLTPILLGLQWDGEDIEWRDTTWYTRSGIPLPHPEGEEKNLSTPLTCDKAQTYLSYVKTGRLTTTIPALDLTQLYEELYSLTNWKAFSGRCQDLRIVKRRGVLMCVPQTVVMGTQSRRAKDSTWLVCPKTTTTKIGSEFRGMVKSPPGYSIVGADFDQEELWLASMLADQSREMLGACEYSRAILVGDKSRGTDTHSLMATRNGMKRDLAKNCNFASAYLCGEDKLATMIHLASGRNISDSKGIAQTYLKSLKGSKINGYFDGGSASAVFNAMVRLASEHGARSPILGWKIPDSLDNAHTRNDYLTTRANWTIQTSGVDVLHVLLTALDLICQRESLSYQLLLTYHDEVKFLVANRDTHRFARALQEAHIKTRAYCYAALGFSTMPQSIAWFSSVEIDSRYRKEISDRMVTPSNPNGFPTDGKSISPQDLV